MKYIIWLLLGLPYLCVGQLYTIYEDGKWGAINKEGEIVLEPQYTKLIPTPIMGIWIAEKNDKQRVWLEELGEVSEAEYDTVVYHEEENYSFFYTKRNGKVGVLDSLGLELIDNQYNQIHYQAFASHNCWRVVREGKVGLLNEYGKLVLPARYDEIESVTDGIVKMCAGEQWGFAHLERKQIIEPQFSAVKGAGSGGVVAERDDGSYVAWNKKGERELDSFVEPTRSLGNGYWAYTKDKKTRGIIYKGGGIITQSIFYDIFRLGEELFSVKTAPGKGSWNILDEKRELLLGDTYDYIAVQDEKWIWVKRGGRWGIYNQFGRLIIEPVLDQLTTFEGGVAIVSINGNLGLINQYGDFLAEALYTNIELLEGVALLENFAGVSQVSFNLAGMPIHTKELVIRKKESKQLREKREESLDPRDYGWVQEEKGLRIGQWWYSKVDRPDRIGHWDSVHIIPNAPFSIIWIGEVYGHSTSALFFYNDPYNFKWFDSIWVADFTKGDIARAVRHKQELYNHDKHAFIINRKGEVRDIGREIEIGEFQHGLARVSNYRGYYGLINEKGRHLMNYQCQELSAFKDGKAIFKYRHRWGKMDTTLKMTYFMQRFDNVEHIGEASLLKIGKRKAMCTLKDSINGEIGSFEADEVRAFREERAIIRIGKKWGAIDTTGRYICRPIYLDAYDFHEGLAAVKTRSRWGYINRKGQLQIELKFSGASSFVSGAALVRYKGKYGLIKRNGRWLLKPKYKHAQSLQGQYFLFWKGNKAGVVRCDGQWVLPPLYDGIRMVGEYFKVGNGNQYGYFNQKGEQILPITYDKLGDIQDNRVLYSNRAQDLGGGRELGEFLFQKQDDGGITVSLIPRDSLTDAEMTNLDRESSFSQERKHLKEEYNDTKVLPHDYAKPNALERRDMGNGMIVGQQRFLYGLADIDGNEVLPPIYESIEYKKGLYQLIKDKRIYYANEEGEIIYPSNEQSNKESN